MKKVDWDTVAGTVIAEIIAVIIIAVAGVIWGLVIEIPFSSAVKYLFSVEIKMWVVILGVFSTLLFRSIYRYYKQEMALIKPLPTPKKLNFVQHKFKKWLWKWDWVWHENSQDYVIVNLRPYCPTCETYMNYHSSPVSSSATCPNCGYTANDLFHFNDFESKEGIGNLIFTKVEKDNLNDKK